MGFKSSVILAASILLLITVFTRLLQIHPHLNRQPPPPRKRGTPVHLLIVLGSGGHTAEMFTLLQDLDPRSYTHRTYIVSSGDSFSAVKAVEFERGIEERYASSRLISEENYSGSDEKGVGRRRRGEREGEGRDATTTSSATKKASTSTYTIHSIPRARNIHQSLLTTPFSALRCLISCLVILRTPPPSTINNNTPSNPPPIPTTPSLILLNGPGTAVIVALASFILRFFTLDRCSSYHPANTLSPNFPTATTTTTPRTRIIYIESWARVKTLSLSGRILTSLGIVDRVLVQWEGLRRRRGVEWMGWMVR